ncbi:MAG: hypothetical protein ABIP17_11680 [Ilumatobacteraceae bacterium]
MLFWFVGTAIVAVWFVFRDPAFDYRLLIVGSVLPAIVDAFFGGARALHSLTFSVVLLAVVMLATHGRRPIRRTLLGLPIGTLLHLVFTGAWTNTRVFWWPFGGFSFGGAPHPVVERGWWNVPFELAGLGLCWWVFRHAGLAEPGRRSSFVHDGRLDLPVSGPEL